MRSPAGSESGSPRPKRPRHWTVQGPISGTASSRRSPPGSPGSTRPAAIWRATAARAIERFGERPVASSSAGARPAISGAEGTSLSWRALGPEPRAPAADHAALDPRRPAGLDQLLDDGPGERLPGPGPPPRAQPGPAADRRAEQRVAAEAAVELGEVVVDAEREAHPLHAAARAAPGRRGAAARSPAAGSRPRRGRPARRAARPVPGRLPRRGPGRGCPRPAAGAMRPRRGRSSRRPRRRGGAGRYGEGGPDLQLHGSRAQAALSGRAGGRRQGRSDWRGRWGGPACAGRAGAGSGCGCRPRRPHGPRRRSRPRPGRRRRRRSPPSAPRCAGRASRAPGRPRAARVGCSAPPGASSSASTSPSRSNFSLTRPRLARACVGTLGGLRKPRNVRVYAPVRRARS